MTGTRSCVPWGSTATRTCSWPGSTLSPADTCGIWDGPEPGAAPGPRPLPEQRRARLPALEAAEQRLGINDCVYEARNVASKISHSAQRRRRTNGRLFMALPCCGRSSAAPAARPRALAQDPQTLTSRTLRWSCPAWGPREAAGAGDRRGLCRSPPTELGQRQGQPPSTHRGAVRGGHHPCRGAWSLRQPCRERSWRPW